MAQDFSLYDPNQFQNMLTQSLMEPYQPAQQAFNTADTFGVNAAFNPPGGGYDPSQFNFGSGQPGGSPTATGGFGQSYNNFMGKYGQSIGQGISAAGALFNLYGGIKSLGLMSKQFKLAKKTTRLGVDNAAIAGNNQIAHHTTATNNSADAAGVPRSGAVYTPFKGWDG